MALYSLMDVLSVPGATLAWYGRHVRLTESNGTVTAVSFEVESTADSWLHSYASQKHLMALAFMGSQRELKPRELFRQDLNYLEMSSYTKQIGIVRIDQQTEIKGYWGASGRLIPVEGEDRYFHPVFSMQKTQQYGHSGMHPLQLRLVQHHDIHNGYYYRCRICR